MKNKETFNINIDINCLNDFYAYLTNYIEKSQKYNEQASLILKKIARDVYAATMTVLNIKNFRNSKNIELIKKEVYLLCYEFFKRLMSLADYLNNKFVSNESKDRLAQLLLDTEYAHLKLNDKSDYPFWENEDLNQDYWITLYRLSDISSTTLSAKTNKLYVDGLTYAATRENYWKRTNKEDSFLITLNSTVQSLGDAKVEYRKQLNETISELLNLYTNVGLIEKEILPVFFQMEGNSFQRKIKKAPNYASWQKHQ